jgi:hypothetical protein
METTTPIINSPESKLRTTMLVWGKYGIIAVCIWLVIKLVSIGYEKKTDYDVTRRDSACPALLSISRSARDTLIIMKAEPLCNDYVLNNLN